MKEGSSPPTFDIIQFSFSRIQFLKSLLVPSLVLVYRPVTTRWLLQLQVCLKQKGGRRAPLPLSVLVSRKQKPSQKPPSSPYFLPAKTVSWPPGYQRSWRTDCLEKGNGIIMTGLDQPVHGLDLDTWLPQTQLGFWLIKRRRARDVGRKVTKSASIMEQIFRDLKLSQDVSGWN